MRTFRAAEDASAWIADHFAGWLDALHEEDRNLARYYKTVRQGAAALNAILRADVALLPDERDFVEALDRVIKEAEPLDRPLCVWRGVPEPPGSWEGIAKGDVLENEGFWSTSAAREVAAVEYGGSEPGACLMKMTLPTGTRAAPLDLLAEQGEAELLLPRDSRFLVTGAAYLPGGARLLELEWLGA